MRSLAGYGARITIISAALLLLTVAAVVFAPRVDDVSLVETFPPVADAAPDTVIRVVFSRAVNRRSAERAFVLYPAAPGRIVWRDDRTLEFVPAAPLASGTIYRVYIRPGLRDARGRINRAESQFPFRVR